MCILLYEILNAQKKQYLIIITNKKKQQKQELVLVHIEKKKIYLGCQQKLIPQIMCRFLHGSTYPFLPILHLLDVIIVIGIVYYSLLTLLLRYRESYKKL